MFNRLFEGQMIKTKNGIIKIAACGVNYESAQYYTFLYTLCNENELFQFPLPPPNRIVESDENNEKRRPVL